MLTTHGTYWKLSPAFARLHSWLEAASLEPAAAPFVIFYDDPAVTPPDLCRYSVCFPLRGSDAESLRLAPPPPPIDPEGAGRERRLDGNGRPPADAFEVWSFPTTAAAVVEYRGPAADSPVVYARLDAWIESHGLRPSGPPRERYLALPGTLGKGIIHVEVQQPLEH